MIKVIETNVMFKDIETPYDAQSRIIEVDNWDDYVNEIKNQKQVNRHSWIGSLYGVSFPKGATMKYFDANDNRLVCTFYRWDNALQMKTACICK